MSQILRYETGSSVPNVLMTDTLRYLKTLFPPQPFHLLVIDLPAFNAKQRGNLPVAIAAILLCQSDQSQPKAVIIAWGCFIALCGPSHADRSASPPLG